MEKIRWLRCSITTAAVRDSRMTSQYLGIYDWMKNVAVRAEYSIPTLNPTVTATFLQTVQRHTGRLTLRTPSRRTMTRNNEHVPNNKSLTFSEPDQRVNGERDSTGVGWARWRRLLGRFFHRIGAYSAPVPKGRICCCQATAEQCSTTMVPQNVSWLFLS